ncbi:protein of unknown function [Hyunsoonleella jejuensis]|uniref:DUF4301 domain-containing protein n=1 Tax=Hyunsoonleella jejuensis TaxID=419940 RepID=A0A1H9BVE4_9FLAO|nr:DUF4301 family protein [Hyunsoonleella jejuensis]SEP92874.1 protein of unknown function [Hyunsoonleella jejuensis]
MFTEKDIEQIHRKGITLDQVNAQIDRLKNGMTHSRLLAAATVGRGIHRFDESEIDGLIKLYDEKKEEYDLLKFVPASGAATRMFKFLFQFLKRFSITKDNIKKYVEKYGDELIEVFVTNLSNFPFYEEVMDKVKTQVPNFNSLTEEEQYVQFIKTMLDENELNYSFFPKGLLPFHKYGDGYITAFEEHLYESTLYASSKGNANLHFTVSEKHQDYFLELLKEIKLRLEKTTNVAFNVSFSFQKEATETIALTKDDKVFRNEDESILFRPGGHGALLENLNDLESDIIFIKNIDNITVKDRNEEDSKYKKLLAGVLLKIQNQVFDYLHELDKGNIDDADITAMAYFLRKQLGVYIHPDFSDFSFEGKINYLRYKFDRPIRVCGMVKNEGEPGGGPFWVKDKNDEISLQIVEFAQIDFSKKQQQSIVYKASHFNPTDLVCGVKNYKGEKFNLLEYVDPEAAFITMKTQNGVDIHALELPGLWNGSMAHWNSIFVEVPLSTFNPVKTVNDLLKPAHQSS